MLVSPFSDLDSVAQSKYAIYPASVLLREKYDNVNWLRDYNGSLLIAHGDKDVVIPPRFSMALFENTKTENKRYILIEGKGHNDLWSSHIFQNLIVDYIEEAWN